MAPRAPRSRWLIALLLATLATRGAAQDDDATGQETQDGPVTLETMLREARDAVALHKQRIVDRVREAIRLFRNPGVMVNRDQVLANERRVLAALGPAALGELMREFGQRSGSTVLGQVSLTLADILAADAPPEVVAELIGHVGSENETRARFAIELLGRLGATAAQPSIRAAARSEQPAIQASALRALAGLRDLESEGLWHAGTRSLHPEVRRAAVQALGHLGRRSDVAYVIPALQDTVDEVARAAAHALGSFGDSTDALRALHDLLSSGNEKLVSDAIKALGKIGSRELSSKYLREVAADKDRVYDLRRQAAQVLDDMGDEYGLAKLADPLKRRILKNPRNPGLRYDLGKLYFEFGKYRPAAQELEKSLTNRTPYNVAVTTNTMIARCHARLGRFKRAGEALIRSGRGYDWSEFAKDPDFEEMASDRKYAKYFGGGSQ